MPSPNFASFFHRCAHLVRLAAAPRRPPSAPAPQPHRVGNKGRERGPPWLTLHGVWVSLIKVTSLFLYELFGVFFPCLECVELSIASRQEILAIIYPLLHQPRVPSLFLLDPTLLMRRDLGAAAFLSNFLWPSIVGVKCDRSCSVWTDLSHLALSGLSHL